MLASSSRILVTHVGSLPRPSKLKQLVLNKQATGQSDPEEFGRELLNATEDTIRLQIEAGLDVIGNGELSRPGFQTYVAARMSGFGGASKRRLPIDIVEFPELARDIGLASNKEGPAAAAMPAIPAAIGAVEYNDLAALRSELDLFERASTAYKGKYAERFITAPSPGIIATTLLNEYYDSHERYVMVLAKEISKEYRAIVENGFVLQVDAPDLAMERTFMYQDEPLSTYLQAVELYVEAINSALQGIPRDRVRLHCCYGNVAGPHLHDVALDEILPLLCRAEVGALSLEFANPRHQHEYAALKQHPLPDHMILLPGVIDSTTNYVEHPQVVANRIEEAVAAMGDRERVIASTDCGFGTFASYELVLPRIVWKKLEAASAGARIASAKLWGRREV